MKFDVTIMPSGDLRRDSALIQGAENLGFGAAWISEAAHDPFLPLTIAAKETGAIHLGTHAALAFPRSPMITAQIAWDLARQSQGRFFLGLGTHTQLHDVERLSENKSDPVGRMREYIESLRAIWDTFHNDARLRYRGEYYTFRLMAPFFNPGPIEHPDVPIYLTGVDPGMCQLAGEICDGLHGHVFHTMSYLRDVVVPAAERGLAASGRRREDFSLAQPVLVVTAESNKQMQQMKSAAKLWIARYASTPACRHVMRHQGWDDQALRLSELARAGQWEAMADVISDEMLSEIGVVARAEDVPAMIEARYGGLADRVSIQLESGNAKLLETIAGGRMP